MHHPFQSKSVKRHPIGYAASPIHIIGIKGIVIAPIPVIHEKCVAVVIVKPKGFQNCLTQQSQRLVLADLNMPVAATIQRHLDYIAFYLSASFFLAGRTFRFIVSERGTDCMLLLRLSVNLLECLAASTPEVNGVYH